MIKKIYIGSLSERKAPSWNHGNFFFFVSLQVPYLERKEKAEWRELKKKRKSSYSLTWGLWQCFQPMKNDIYILGLHDAKPKWLQINWKISWIGWVTESVLGLFGTKAERVLLFGCWYRWPCEKHTINCCNCGMISQVDRFLSHSLSKKWAHLSGVCRGIYIKSTLLLLSKDRLPCMSTNIQESDPHLIHLQELTFFTASFSDLFLEV